MNTVKIELISRGASPAIYLIGDAPSARAARAHVRARCTLAAAIPSNWNGDLSPWYAPKCFKGGDDFAGGADAFLDGVARAVAGFEKDEGIKAQKRALCGYSLAGLCALYGLYACDIFDGAGSASGSMWFDGWLKYMAKSGAQLAGKSVYLSVGDREKNARNIRLARVEQCTRRAAEILESKGARTKFELNNGNHFVDAPLRLARAIDWLCGELGAGSEH